MEKKGKGRLPYLDVWHAIGGGINDLNKGLTFLLQKDYNNNKYFHEELIRELSEEVYGLIIDYNSISSIIPVYKNIPRISTTVDKDGRDVKFIFLEYLCNYVSGNLSPNSDIVQLKWVKRDKLKHEQLTSPKSRNVSRIRLALDSFVHKINCFICEAFTTKPLKKEST